MYICQEPKPKKEPIKEQPKKEKQKPSKEPAKHKPTKEQNEEVSLDRIADLLGVK